MTDSWDEKKELTKLVFGPILTPPLGELIAEGDRLKEKAEKLESVREFVLSRKYDIKMDIENFGMLKPILKHFLEAAENS